MPAGPPARQDPGPPNLIQSSVLDEPAWLLRARALLPVDPARAMPMALAAAAVLAADLHDRITESA